MTRNYEKSNRPKFIHDGQQQSSPPLDLIWKNCVKCNFETFISIYKYLYQLLFRIALNSFNSLYGNVCALLMNRCDNMAERGKTSQFSYVLLNDITQFKYVMEESLSSLLKLTCPYLHWVCTKCSVTTIIFSINIIQQSTNSCLTKLW